MFKYDTLEHDKIVEWINLPLGNDGCLYRAWVGCL
jgi:hypothetical protein